MMDKSSLINIQLAVERLQNADILSPQPDITTILSHSFHIPRHRAITGDFVLSEEEWARFHETIGERATHAPLQYILGKCDFWKYEFNVTPDVLIPRPETEHLVETALNLLPSRGKKLIIDCCTGSGCVAISIALERPENRVIGCDISTSALNIAKINKNRLSADNCSFLATDMLTSFAPSSVDLITANPPYVAEEEAPALQPELGFEPRKALFSGNDGLTHIRSLLKQAPVLLKKKGYLAFEFGYNQGEAIRELVEPEISGKIHRFEIIRDLANHERIGVIQYA